MNSHFLKGVNHGIPIALGYLSVSFGFGILAVRTGLTVLEALFISVTNLTSAGQAAGVAVIAASGTLLEMALTQLVINLRYALMAFSLSQRLDNTFRTPQRLLVSFSITDEIFAVAVSQPEKLTSKYMYGLILTPFIGWSAGTLIGAAAGELLPASVCDAMGLLLYGMFIAIIVPASKKSGKVLFVVALTAGLSLICNYVFTFISSGFSVIICAVIASVVCALIFPIEEGDEQ